ncbi:MAG: hypothetical protein QOG13_1753 [Sphingomonadales bacterium]|nr:hypothetical protein [Sphingomonadales bacterium]
MRAPPLRFLALVVGGWVCLRAAVLLPDVWPRPAADIVSRAGPTSTTLPPPTAGSAIADISGADDSAIRSIDSLIRDISYKGERTLPANRAAALRPDGNSASGLPAGPALRRSHPAEPSPLSTVAAARSKPAQPLPLRPPAPSARRWSASAWLLVRPEPGGSSLAPGGTLGGSQAGARLRYRVGGGLALSGRAYAPLRRAGGAEVALGLDWQPLAALPLNLLAERRQAIGRRGRSAFSITLHGGASRTLAGALKLDAYVQAGLVGLRSRDAFVDGAARVGWPLGPLEVGAGAWGAAQPGAARLDAGPVLSYRLPTARANLRLEASWRLRVAGDAQPGSGPALIVATDF